VEPFLKRCAVHFGHTVDYIARVIVWRHLAKGDLDVNAWGEILAQILKSHGQIGNDSEVCWAVYACSTLDREIDGETCAQIARNCGALSLVSILNSVKSTSARTALLKLTRERLKLETAAGA
jgi:hypothetical protein